MHLLHQHTIDVQCSSQDFGKELHHQLGPLMEKELYPKMEQLFNQYQIQNHTWIIDLLEITLPKISKENWKKEFIHHSLIKIEAFLKDNTPFVNVNYENQINSLVLSSQRRTQLFFTFLKTGILVENSISKKIELLLNEIEINDDFIKELYAFFIANPRTIIRWVFAVPDFFKKKVITLLTDFPFQINHFVLDILQKNEMALVEFQNEKELFFQWIELVQWFDFLYTKATSKSTLFAEFVRVSERYWKLTSMDLLQVFSVIDITLQKEINKVAASDVVFFKTVKKQLKFISVEVEEAQQKIKSTPFKKNAEINYHYISNSGLVLLHPFLKMLFEQLELCENEVWKNLQSQHKAILLTQYLVTGKTDVFENELVLNKIFCGLSVEEEVNTKLKITKKDKEKCQSLLEAVLEYWTSMNKSSVEALRESFLVRAGKLDLDNSNAYELFVEEKGYDILLGQLPWGIGMVKTPWMNEYLTCNWN